MLFAVFLAQAQAQVALTRPDGLENEAVRLRKRGRTAKKTSPYGLENQAVQLRKRGLKEQLSPTLLFEPSNLINCYSRFRSF